MKHVGILAHSTEGAALCFLDFCQEGFRRLGRNEHPDVTLDYIAFGYSMPAWEAGDHGSVRATLAVSVRRLARAGADFFACPDNTAHLALEQPGEDLALPGLHIAEVVAGQAARDGRRKVAVLGTTYLMDGPVYPRALAAHGIAAEVPDAGDRRILHEIIFDELVNGVFTDRSRQEYVRVIGQLAARGCDAAALVCTEIPLLVTPEMSPLPTLDSTRLLARAAFGVATGEQAMPTWRGGPPAQVPDGRPRVRRRGRGAADRRAAGALRLSARPLPGAGTAAPAAGRAGLTSYMCSNQADGRATTCMVVLSAGVRERAPVETRDHHRVVAAV